MATLDVLEDEGLQQNALETGVYAISLLEQIEHPLKAEARGHGLFFGIEFTEEDGKPATGFADRVAEAMLHRGVLLNRIGRHMNTLKMRPPMPFTQSHCNLAIETLSEVLNEVPVD